MKILRLFLTITCIFVINTVTSQTTSLKLQQPFLTMNDYTLVDTNNDGTEDTAIFVGRTDANGNAAIKQYDITVTPWNLIHTYNFPQKSPFIAQDSSIANFVLLILSMFMLWVKRVHRCLYYG